jgi:zinc transport system ATP-binding protein
MTATDHVVCLNGHVCCSGTPKDIVKNNEYKSLFGDRASQILSIYEHKHDHVHSNDGDIKKN